MNTVNDRHNGAFLLATVVMPINSGYIIFSAYAHNLAEYVIVIAQDQGLMAVNWPESEGVAQGRGWFMLP